MKVKILEIHPNSAHYGDKDSLIGGVGIFTQDKDSDDTEYVLGEGWRSGRFRFRGATFYFCGVKVEEVDG